MRSISNGVFNTKKYLSNQVARFLAVSLIVALISQLFIPMQSSVVHAETAASNSNGYLDKVVFGDAASESAHQFKGDFTTSTTGFLGQPARVSNPRTPLEGQGGDLTFTIKVDPYLQNYFTMKFSDEAGHQPVLVVNGEQVGFYRNGDYTFNRSWGIPNRFLYYTIMLPLETTVGKETVEITIKTMNVFGNMDTTSKKYYTAYTHPQAYLNVEDEPQGAELFPADMASIVKADITDAEKQAKVDAHRQAQISRFNTMSGQIDSSAGAKFSIERYKDDMRYYSRILNQSWSPANTPELKKAALARIFKSIDNHVKDYYADSRRVLRGGHQGDWGSYYSALGEALYIVENLIKDDAVYGQAAFDAFLNQPFVTGTAAGEFSLAGVDWNGGELTRREAWERALKASFDFARSRLSYIYNQQLYTYEGAWEAHEGLGIIGSSFFEGKQRSHDILLEALGVIPFLGEEVLVGPNGEELDVYHSLFHHDGAAVFTNDYVHIIGKGLAKSKLDAEGKVERRKPYGEHYVGITEAGLSRENTYVGNYGEAVNYLPEYFYKTLNHAGDEALNDEILKLALKTINARKYLRVPMLNGDKNRVMTADQTLDERNEGPIGFDAYGPKASSGTALLFASLEMAMVQNEQRYSGPEWEKYWQYAKEAVGFTQQQMLDNQLFNHGFGSYSASMSSENFLVPEVYSYLTGERDDYERLGGTLKASVILPHTDFDYYTPEEMAELGVDPADYQQFAWADIDNMILSVRDGDLSFNGSLYLRNRGLAGNGRLHVMKDNYESVVQVATNSKFQYEDYYIRTQNVDVDFMSDQAANVANLPQALAGEVNPSAYQPGVGRVNRDNFEVDHPYSGYPDLMTARYGKYFMAINTTRSEYGNEQSFEIELPSDYNGSTVLDLVTGANVPVVNGKVTISHKSAMVLKLNSEFDAAQKPYHVDFVNALAGNGYVGLSWRTAAGGKTYTIKRSTTENGTYETIATGVTGNYYKDTDVQNGSVYYYKVAAVNDNGAGWDSWRAKADLTAPVSGITDGVWRDDRIGTSSGSATVNGASVAIASAGGTGLGTGDDYNIYNRNINDSLHFVSQVVGGDSTVSAKIDSQSGAASGIMLRDQLASNTRYMYFGADKDGNLVLQSRTRDSRVQWSGIVMSPYNPGATGYKAADYPYIKLVREHDSQNVNAFVSKDGVAWEFVKKMMVLLPYAYHAGVVAADQAQFSEVSVMETPRNIIEPYIVKAKDQVTVHWNKPKQAAYFHLYRTNDEAASLTDPVFKTGTTELVDGSPWTKVLAGTRATSFKEASLKYGSLHYKVMAVHGDGSLQLFSATVSAYADSIAVVMGDAESLPAKDYTKASFYLYHKELDRVKAEIAKPDFDEEQLINDIYAAKSLLVSFRTLLTKVQMQPSMVRASEKYWGNDNISEAQNGWFLFDGITTNLTHTRSAVSWVDIDFGAGNEKVVDTFKYLPRESHFTRANNTVFKGSNDGVNWVDLHKITGITSFKWYSAINPDPTPYRYIRIYDNHSGFVNFQEVELLERGIDKTLLTQLLDESAAAVAAEIYTAESLQLLEQAVTAATPIAGNENATQEEIDAAAEDLVTALKGLQYIPGMPVLDSIGNKTVIAEKELSFVVQATNTDADIVYGVSGLPEGATFNADTQTFAWTPAKEQSGVYAVTFTATSGEKSSSQTIKITVKGQPIFSSDTNVELTAKQQITYKVTATDLSGEALSYSAGNLPAGAVFNASTGAFIWTPGQADYGSHPVTFTVSNSNFSVTQIVDFKVMLNILSSTDITKGSYYLYMKEVERIEAEMAKPEADKVQLAAELGQAEGLLVPVPSLYAFEGNADNSLGTSHGTVDGTPVYTEGKVGQAFNMSGDDYATLPASHIMSTYNEITFATWVYWRGGSNWQRIFDFGNNTNQYMFLTPSSGNNTLRFAIKNGGGEQMVQTSQLAANQWVHVAVTLGNGTAQLYVNGEQKATVNGFTIKPSDFKPSKNYIGKSQWPDPLYNGLVDEFRIYNHVLTVEEIQAVVNNTAKWIDNSLLTILLEEASAINADYYTEESVAVLQKAVSDAELVSANADATQAEINAADAPLLAALKGLQWKDVSTSFDPAVPNGKNGWYTSPVTVTLSPTPIAEYSLDGGSSWAAYDAPINLKEEGTHKLLYRSVKTGEEKSLEVKIDLTAPVAKITGAASYTIDQTVTMTCTATDVTSSVYGTPCDKPMLQAKAYTLVAGQNSVTFTAEDTAGHATTVTHTFTVKATFDSLKTVTYAFLQAKGAKGWEGVAKSLNYKLDQAKAAAGRGDTAAVKDLMTSYIGQVTDQSGKTLTKEQADILIRWAQSLI
ncbi:LamG-like jellyroll fold domain-containing protein [Paenibacillus prosopidis]|uniref:Putative Ig domain-containing protein n=1 Tax=Paenibacillus prosopidis TaxID=630520 RepID=A0A368VXD9_9BACL|nr:LamG-like jellyroll fold domain-containing protein [Paenibacillus prosopidis]RCW45452.1 putative Ig domain-containing protein [Paenibacillus prosopidis]